MRVGRVRRGVVLADDDLPHAGLDTVAADDGVRCSRGAVPEGHDQPAVVALADLLQALAELGLLGRQQLDQLVEVVGAVDAVLAEAGADGEGDALVAALGAVDVVEPDVLLGRPAVARAHALEGLVHARVDGLHGLHGVGAEGHARADLAKVRRALVQRERDPAPVQRDGQRQAGYAAADDGDLKVLGRRHALFSFSLSGMSDVASIVSDGS